MVLHIYYHILKRKVISLQPISLPMGKVIVLETCTSAPYIQDHCDDITPEPQMRPMNHTFHDDIAIC